MSINTMSRGIEGGIFAIGMKLEADLQARRNQRTISTDFANLGMRWSNYCQRLAKELLASQKREKQLSKDLADALLVIERLERRH